MERQDDVLRRALRAVIHRGVVALVAGGLAWAACAQTSAPPVTRASSAGPQGVVASPAPAAYEDRLIDGGALAPDEEDAGRPYNAEGWARYWRAEGVASYFDQQGVITRENGLRLVGRVDTPNYGALSADAVVRVDPGSFIGTLVQRDFAFDTHWRVNNSLGVVSTLGIDLTRTQYRFYLPTFPSIGATTEWIRDGNLQLQASGGQPGNFNGFRLEGFESLHGSLATVGAQWALAPQWQVGAQYVDTRDVESPYASTGLGTIDSQAGFVSLAWANEATRLQANVLGSDASTAGKSVRANGIWLDGSTRANGITHNYGVFRLEPGLAWGYQPINNDIEGAYYRFSYANRRWQMDGGVDQVNSISGINANGTYFTLNGRYQIDSRMGAGGNGGYLRNGGSYAALASVYGDLVWSQGVSRLQFSASYNNSVPSTDAQQVALDHTWNMPAGTRLATTFTATRDSTGGNTVGDANIPRSTIKRLGMGVVGGGDVTNNLSLDANLQYNLMTLNGSASGLYGTFNLTWRITPQWSLLASYFDNSDDSARLFVIDPLVPVIGDLPTQRSRAVMLSIRYEERAGTSVVPIGGRPGSPAGVIAGTLFLDLNDNGLRDAGEPGAPGVTVLLNGRFPTRTDEAGRYEFSFVAAGNHTLSVIPDNLALPWSVAAKIPVDVAARATSTTDIAARRVR